jgi:GNAT superfamily N-acetyltransferase
VIRDLVVDLATDRDVDAILDLERRGWPEAGSMQADRDRFCCRISLGGMIVARLGAAGKLVGAISTFRPRWIHPEILDELLGGCPDDLLALPGEQCWIEIRARYRLPRDWHAATDDGRLGGGAQHDPDGEVVFGIGITTDPRERQHGIAQALLDGALAIARRQGARHFVAYSRLPMYSLHASDTPERYVSRTVQRDGVVKPFDFGFRLHWAAGAKPLRSARGRSRYIVIPGSMPDDTESLTCGVLVITPLDDRSVFPFETAIASPPVDRELPPGAAISRESAA